MTLKRLRKSVIKFAFEGKIVSSLDFEEYYEKYYNDFPIKIEKSNIKDDKFIVFPSNWKVFQLGSIVQLISGRDLSPSQYNDKKQGIPYITGASNFIDKNILINRWTTNPKVISKKQDLLITVKGTIGDMSINDIGDVHIARQVMAIRTENIDIKYLMYLLEVYLDKLKEKAKSFIPGISRKDLLTLPVPLPPVDEQKSIVKKLDELLPLVDKLEQYEKELIELEKDFQNMMKQSILKSVISGCYTNNNEFINYEYNDLNIAFNIPVSWDVRLINEVASLMTGNSIPVSMKKTKYSKVKEGHDYIATKDIQFDNTIFYNNGIKTPYDESNFRIAKKGNILLCIEGGSAGRKVGLLVKDVTFGNKLCSFAPIDINNEYLYYFIQSPLFQTQFKNSVTGIIGGVGINKIRQFLIPVPPIEEQKQIVKLIKEIFANI